MRWQEIDVEHRAVGEILDLIQSGNFGDECAATDIDENPGRSQRFIPHDHRLSRSEAGMAFEHRDTGVVAKCPFHAARGEAQNIVLAFFHFFHIDRDRPGGGHAEFSRATDEMRCIGARHKRLGRRAAGIDARATKAVALDHGDPLSRCS
jgi:hypothetical protein